MAEYHATRKMDFLIPQKAVELEATEFLRQEHYERSADGPLRGHLNGSGKAPDEEELNEPATNRSGPERPARR